MYLPLLWIIVTNKLSRGSAIKVLNGVYTLQTYILPTLRVKKLNHFILIT